MLKRLYLRALEWALAPVLCPVREGVASLQNNYGMAGSQIADLQVKIGCALEAIEAAQADIEAIDRQKS